MNHRAALAVVAILAVACGQTPATPTKQQPPHVFLIVMENHSSSQAMQGQFTWISPDMCHDTHDCSVSVGDSWLRTQVGEITTSKAWKDGGILFITWDEDDGSTNNRVLTLVIAPGKSHLTSSKQYNHYSLLATIEDLMGVGRLGAAAQATPMTDLIN